MAFVKRRDLDYVVITLLVGSSIYVFLTGLIADTMGLHHFGWHSQAGYLWVALAVAHLLQTWSRVKAFVAQRFRERTALVTEPKAASPNAGQDRRAAPTSPVRRNLLLFVIAIATGIGFDQLVTPQSVVPPSDGTTDIGLLYHRWSQPGYGEAMATMLNWGSQPPLYKSYPEPQQVELPKPSDLSSIATMAVAAAITARRSRRRYSPQSKLSLEHLSQLLYLAQGITWEERDFRTVPSSGALYPLEIYPIVQRVEGLEPGLYHHAVQQHRLERVKPGDFSQSLVKAGLNQDFLGEAQVCFVVSGIFQRTRWKYHERAYRYVLLEAGHLGQNLYLAATALGLNVCGVGAFFDEPLNELLGIDGQTEAALYLVTVGHG